MGLQFSRRFTKTGKSPFDMFEYDYRTSVIRNASGEKVFEMTDVEVPKHWSQIATDILAQKYFRKTGVPDSNDMLGQETSIKQVAHRLAHCWRTWGEKHGYFQSKQDAEIFYDELIFSIVDQSCAPNSPQWFNTGLHNSYGIEGKPYGHYYVDPKTNYLQFSQNAYERPQSHACFILSVDDDLVNEGGIMDLWVREARIFKYGSGVGTNYSNIRAEGEKLSSGGTSSGLMSFLKIGDRAAGAIKSGGTTRRAAKMVCLDLDHPEVVDFVDWKLEEEKKVTALIAAGYSSDYEGEAYNTVSGQNSNNSVRIPNEFFNCLDRNLDWEMTARGTGKVMRTISAKALWDKIGYSTWRCGDPSTQYSTTINEWHTCPEGGPIRASNVCSEYMFLDNTACNLASLNLRRFFNEETSTFDVQGFEYMARLWTVVLEISVVMAQFPAAEVAQLTFDYRPIGLGHANLGSMLMLAGIAYDSEEGRAMASAITAIMSGAAYRTSAEMARTLGTFPRFEENKQHMMRVIRNHRAAAYDAAEGYEGLEILPLGINARYCPGYLLRAAAEIWDDAVKMGEQYGYRNAQATVIAPTGTISLIMDCDTTGVQPDFSLVKLKKNDSGGYSKIINPSLPVALKKLGYTPKQIDVITKYAKGNGTFYGAPFINEDTLKEKGLLAEELRKLDELVENSFDLRYVFSVYSLGEDCLKRIGFEPSQYLAPHFDLLEALGFSEEEIEASDEYVCGTMTVENAPYLRQEHLPIFDCSKKCGKKGQRVIHHHGHLRMMGAVQSFISGAMSMTINLPNEATVQEIQDCYYLSWQLGLKACTLYRDGSKFNHPLSKTEKTTLDEVLANLIEELGIEKNDSRFLQLSLEEKVEYAEIAKAFFIGDFSKLTPPQIQKVAQLIVGSKSDEAKRALIEGIGNTAILKHFTDDEILFVPSEVRTAFIQYVSFFDEYVKETKGKDIEASFVKIQEGIGFKFSHASTVERSLIFSYLQEYSLQLILKYKNIEELYEIKKNIVDMKLFQMKLDHEIDSFKTRYNLLIKENEIREIQNSEISNLRRLLECAIYKNNLLGNSNIPINISIHNENHQTQQIDISNLIEWFSTTKTIFEGLPGFPKEDLKLLEEIKEILFTSVGQSELPTDKLKPKMKAFYKQALNIIGDAKKIFVDAPQLYSLLKNASSNIYEVMLKISNHTLANEIKHFIDILKQMI